jgi:predicted nucleic acid-binding protein
MKSVFVDTSFIIALYNKDDECHRNAIAILPKIKGCPLVLTQAIILEIGNAFSSNKRKSAGVKIIKWIESSGEFQIIPYDKDLHKKAFQLYASRIDKDWSLTDCISFVVMKDYGIEHALATDRHFAQAGFKCVF